jgi:hypothetical protein
MLASFETCTDDGPGDCVFDGRLVPLGTSINVYASPHPVSGSCVADRIGCVAMGGTIWTGAWWDRFSTCTTAPSDCNPTQTADLSNNGQPYTRQCSGSVVVNQNDGAHSYSTDLSEFGEVYGYPANGSPTGWPGSFPGFSPTFHIIPGQFVSLRFSASPARTINLEQNPSYGYAGILVTISKRPGVFNANDPDMVCSNAANIVSSSGSIGGTSCVLSDSPLETYYLNYAEMPGDDCLGIPGACPASYVAYYVY